MDFFKGISEVFRGKNGFLSYENKEVYDQNKCLSTMSKVG